MPYVPADEAALSSERARLVRLCYRLTGNLDAAEDLAQETLYEAVRNAHKLHDRSGYDQLTLGEDVGLGQPDRMGDRARLEEAGERAGIGDLVRALLVEYETLLGPDVGGVDLSGGQWQRVAIARGAGVGRADRCAGSTGVYAALFERAHVDDAHPRRRNGIGRRAGRLQRPGGSERAHVRIAAHAAVRWGRWPCPGRPLCPGVLSTSGVCAAPSATSASH